MAAVTNNVSGRLALTATIGGVSVHALTQTYTGADSIVAAVVVTAGAVDQEVDFPCPVSTLQLFAMSSDQDLTVKTNSNSSPTPTISLKKAAGLLWTPAFVNPIPFPDDITKFYVSNPGSVDAKFTVGALHN